MTFGRIPRGRDCSRGFPPWNLLSTRAWGARRGFLKSAPKVTARWRHLRAQRTRRCVFWAWLNVRVSFSRKWLFFAGRKTVPEKMRDAPTHVPNQAPAGARERTSRRAPIGVAPQRCLSHKTAGFDLESSRSYAKLSLFMWWWFPGWCEVVENLRGKFALQMDMQTTVCVNGRFFRAFFPCFSRVLRMTRLRLVAKIFAKRFVAPTAPNSSAKVESARLWRMEPRRGSFLRHQMDYQKVRCAVCRIFIF